MIGLAFVCATADVASVPVQKGAATSYAGFWAAAEPDAVPDAEASAVIDNTAFEDWLTEQGYARKNITPDA